MSRLRLDLNLADGDWEGLRRNFRQLEAVLGVLGQVPVFAVTPDVESPAGVVVASPPALCVGWNSGGTEALLFFKQTGVDDSTGWGLVDVS